MRLTKAADKVQACLEGSQHWVILKCAWHVESGFLVHTMITIAEHGFHFALKADL